MPPKTQRSVPTRALAIAAALMALLAVVAVATRATHPTSSGDDEPRLIPLAFFDYVFTISAVGAIVILIVLAYYRAELQKERRERPNEIRQLLRILGVIALVSFVAVVIGERLQERGQKGLSVPTISTPTTGAAATQAELMRRQQPRFRWEAVVALGLVAGGITAAWFLFRPKPKGEDRTLREDLAAILQDTLDKLWDEQDPRRAVILAYAWMERTLAAHGLPRDPSEAPLEYLARVLIDLDASKESVLELTTLFERARFSEHVIDDEMKHDAIVALSAVRDELSAQADE